ncbi:MAG: hypothetical protein M4579_005695 [Chaenotheca gracillima]|nr:MAG: hypothetical protein M4579_005695 [Chaenotheca gracillima]
MEQRGNIPTISFEARFLVHNGVPPANPAQLTEGTNNGQLMAWNENGLLPLGVEAFQIYAGARPGPVLINGEAVGLKEGWGYVFPTCNTTLYIIEGDQAPYDYAGLEFSYKVFRAPCNLKVKELLVRLGATEGPDNQNSVTECLIDGLGNWDRGLSIFKGGANEGSTLESLGWDETRNEDDQGPVWLLVSRGAAA